MLLTHKYTKCLFANHIQENSDNIEIKQLELINANQKIEVSELSQFPSKREKQYVRLIRKWLKGEEAYLSKIASILRNSPHNNMFVD